MVKKKFGIVYTEIIQDPDLSLRAKGLYAILCSYADKERKCYPSISTLAESAGVTRRTIERTLIELEQKDYVRRQGKYFHLR